jgi:hypothetical protein
MNTMATPSASRGTWAVRVSIGTSILLVISWTPYLLYLLTTRVDKQSVYVGSITFWTAVLFVVCAIVLVVDLACLSVAWLKGATGRGTAGIAFLAAAVLTFILFFASGKIVDARLLALRGSDGPTELAQYEGTPAGCASLGAKNAAARQHLLVPSREATALT